MWSNDKIEERRAEAAAHQVAEIVRMLDRERPGKAAELVVTAVKVGIHFGGGGVTLDDACDDLYEVTIF